SQYGAWMFPVFRLLAKLRFLRGSVFDVFGRTQERKKQRALIVEYETTLHDLLARLEPDTHALCVQIASVPDEIRGFGHVMERHLQAAKAKEAKLIAALHAPAERAAASALATTHALTTPFGDRAVMQTFLRGLLACPPCFPRCLRWPTSAAEMHCP